LGDTGEEPAAEPARRCTRGRGGAGGVGGGAAARKVKAEARPGKARVQCGLAYVGLASLLIETAKSWGEVDG
jgi:hypothetical protein